MIIAEIVSGSWFQTSGRGPFWNFFLSNHLEPYERCKIRKFEAVEFEFS